MTARLDEIATLVNASDAWDESKPVVSAIYTLSSHNW